MPLELAQVTADDLPTVLQLQFAAFADDPMTQLMYPIRPTPVAVVEKAIERGRKDFLNPDTAFVKVHDTDSGEIVALAKWSIYKHERPGEEWKKEEKRDWGEGVNVEAADALIGAIGEKRKKIMAGKPHCCRSNGSKVVVSD